MQKEYKEELIGDLEGVDPLDYLDDSDEEEGQIVEKTAADDKPEGVDEPDYYDYGELSDGGDDDAEADR